MAGDAQRRADPQGRFHHQHDGHDLQALQGHQVADPAVASDPHQQGGRPGDSGRHGRDLLGVQEPLEGGRLQAAHTGHIDQPVAQRVGIVEFTQLQSVAVRFELTQPEAPQRQPDRR